MKNALIAAVGLIFLLRLFVIMQLPLTGDEAYYWEWSLRPAFGYVDHPPAVAWTIAAFAWLGRSPWAIRCGFWLCGVVTTLAAADAARRLAGAVDGNPARAVRAGLQTAFFISMAPIASLAFTTASPDGPYLAAWAIIVDLACMLEAAAGAAIGLEIALGAALAAALMARAFSVALVVGVVCGFARRPKRLLVIIPVMLLGCIPFLLWNAQHAWATIVFTFAGRHVNEGFSPFRLLIMIAESCAALGIFSTPLLFRFGMNFPSAVVRWTALPLPVLLCLVALFERVETYWFLGPYISLCVLAAADLSQRCGNGISPRGLRAAAAFSYGLTAFVLCLAIAPYLVFHTLSRTVHLRLHNAGIFEIYTYAPLARDVRGFSLEHHAAIMTDGYGLSSLLDFHAGVTPLVIGYTWQGRESRRWVSEQRRFPQALFVDKEPLADRPDFGRQLARACRAVEPGPIFSYTLPGLPARVYSSTWCRGLKADGIATLRWE